MIVTKCDSCGKVDEVPGQGYEIIVSCNHADYQYHFCKHCYIDKEIYELVDDFLGALCEKGSSTFLQVGSSNAAQK